MSDKHALICPHCGGIVPADSFRSADRAIEHYYRSRAAGRRKTLRQIADETGYSHEYLRKRKRKYDAAGGWGSKKRTVIDNP